MTVMRLKIAVDEDLTPRLFAALSKVSTQKKSDKLTIMTEMLLQKCDGDFYTDSLLTNAVNKIKDDPLINSLADLTAELKMIRLLSLAKIGLMVEQGNISLGSVMKEISDDSEKTIQQDQGNGLEWMDKFNEQSTGKLF